MREITISDQMGAMAIVDGLRHQQLLVNEYLDLHQRRSELAFKLRAYYQQQGITATDDLIERGVREHFSNRLTLRASKLGLGGRIVFKLLSNRKGFARGLARGGLITIASMAVVSILNLGFRHYQVSSVEAFADKAALGVSQLRTEASHQREQLNALTATHNAGDVTAAEPIVEGMLDRLSQVAQKLDFRLPAQIDASNYEDTRTQINGYNSQFMEAKNLLWLNREGLIAVNDIYNTWDSYHQLIATQSFKDGIARYPSLRVSAKAAEQALESAQSDGGKEAKERTDSLRTSLTQLMAMDVLSDKVRALESTYAKMNLNGKDEATIQAMIGSSKAAIDALNLDQAREDVDQLTGMVPCIQQRLSIDIVSQGQSGIERTFHPGGGSSMEGGKSWFAVVQATDAGGNVLKAPVTDAYTGARLMTSKFAVRISHEEYLRIKADKADGQIDDAHIGDKPANSLSINWSPRTLSSSPSIIFNW